MRRTEPTEEELRHAWRHIRRDSWPETFEQAMADPTLSRLVRITAMHPPRALRKAAPTPQPAHIVATAPRPLPQPRTAPYFDRKRAAAGDRDD